MITRTSNQVMKSNDAPTVYGHTEESESLSSVEIAQSSKGEPRITVKAYAADIHEAGARALTEYRHLLAQLGGAA